MDHLIRDALRRDVQDQEPSAEVRSGLLARATAHTAQSETVVGASIPPLVNGLREVKPMLHGSVHLPVLEVEFMDFFGSAQQRLIAVWMLSSSSRY